MKDHSIPVVRLEVEYMKHAILHAFTEHTLKVDQDVKAAVEHFCRPENVRAIVAQAVDSVLKDAIEGEIRDFFMYGAGREALAQAVKDRLNKQGFCENKGCRAMPGHHCQISLAEERRGVRQYHPSRIRKAKRRLK